MTTKILDPRAANLDRRQLLVRALFGWVGGMKRMFCLATVALAAALGTLSAAGGPAERLSEWSQPVNLGPTVNTADFEVCPFLTQDGLSLYFGSNRPGGVGAVDIYVSRRASANDEWEPPQNLGPAINSDVLDNCPFVTPDGHTLIFLRNPGLAGIDLYVSSRRNKRNDLGWKPAVPLAALNTPSDEFGVTGYLDEDTDDLVVYFTSNRPGGSGGTDIYKSRTRGDGTLRPPTLVAELSTSANDQFPSVRKDGRELFLIRSRRHNRQFGLLGGHTTEDIQALELAGKPRTDSQ